MNVKVKELKGKLAKSSRRTLMIATLCGDDKFVARVVDWNQADVYKSLDEWKDHWKNINETDNEETLGDIANNAVVALKDAQKGKDSVERARYFLESFTSLTFESKDKLEKDDYCNAVIQLRLVGKMVLPEDKIVDPTSSRKSDSKIKDFKRSDAGANKDKKTKFFQVELTIAQESVGRADTDDGKKLLDKNEEKSAGRILKFIYADDKLNDMTGSFSSKFATWAAEQLYGLKPEFVDVIQKESDDRRVAANMFNQYILWLKANKPNEYIEYLAESTVADDNGEGKKKKKRQFFNPPTINITQQEDIPNKQGASEGNNFEDGYRPCTVPYTGKILVGPLIDIAPEGIGSPEWRQNALKQIRERRAAEEAKASNQ